MKRGEKQHGQSMATPRRRKVLTAFRAERGILASGAALAGIIHGWGDFFAVCYEISTTRKRVISVRTTRLRVVLIAAHE